MNEQLKKIREYIAQTPLCCENSPTGKIIDELHWLYTESNPPVNEKVRNLYNRLNNYIADLPLAKNDEIMDIFSDIGLEQERLAFQGGLRYGMQLALELMDQEKEQNRESEQIP